MGIMPDRFNSTSAPKYNPPNYSYPERRSAEIATLRAVLIECRDWFESPGGDPDSGEILRHINDALGDRGSMSTDGEVASILQRMRSDPEMVHAWLARESRAP